MAKHLRRKSSKRGLGFRVWDGVFRVHSLGPKVGVSELEKFLPVDFIHFLTAL